ncbi:hypothetical protein [Mycobacterium sp. 1164985.4]|uniref:hypothetical protein n=1 Tax=Mycobacterium sp. 1164985.4 TaxID=1834069 RepID=UPI0007FBAEBA|nr:hypothetical protein [Mycobacterium sp. 1164985.4]OBK75089.1 hypothetical protein A5650_18570 [Mycobacterium sp. 1164985.4]
MAAAPLRTLDEVPLSTALRIASILVVVKAVLIGAVYWRRAEIMGRPVDAGLVAWTVLAGLVAVAVLLTVIALVARYLRDRG